MSLEESSEFVGRRLFGLDGPFSVGWKWKLPGSMYSFLPSFATDIDASRIIKKMNMMGYVVSIKVTEKAATVKISSAGDKWSSTNDCWKDALLLATHDALSSNHGGQK